MTPQLEDCSQLWGPQKKKDKEGESKAAMKMIRGLQQVSYEESWAVQHGENASE